MPAPPKPERRGPKPRKPLKRGAIKNRGSRPRFFRATPLAEVERKATALHSKYILARDPICRIRAVCNGSRSTDTAHFLSRTYSHVKHHPQNAWGACRECHVWMTARPILWKKTWTEALGEQTSAKIIELSRLGGKPDFHEAIEKLETLLSILAAATAGVAQQTWSTVDENLQQRGVPNLLQQDAVHLGRDSLSGEGVSG